MKEGEEREDEERLNTMFEHLEEGKGGDVDLLRSVKEGRIWMRVTHPTCT